MSPKDDKKRMARADLPHEIIKGNYGPRDIKRSIECIGKVVVERICLPRMKHSRAFLVAHRSTWLQSRYISTQSCRTRASIKRSYISDAGPVTCPVVVDAERDKA